MNIQVLGLLIYLITNQSVTKQFFNSNSTEEPSHSWTVLTDIIYNFQKAERALPRSSGARLVDAYQRHGSATAKRTAQTDQTKTRVYAVSIFLVYRTSLIPSNVATLFTPHQI